MSLGRDIVAPSEKLEKPQPVDTECQMAGGIPPCLPGGVSHFANYLAPLCVSQCLCCPHFNAEFSCSLAKKVQKSKACRQSPAFQSVIDVLQLLPVILLCAGNGDGDVSMLVAYSKDLCPAC